MKQDNRIDRYLSDKMEVSEKNTFENDLISDQELKKQTDRRRILISGIKTGFKSEFKEKLISEDKQLNKNGRSVLIKYVSGIAAALIIGFLSYILLVNKKADTANLYAEYYRPYPNIETPLSRSEDTNINPYYLYESGNYRDAIKEFGTIIKDNSKDNQSALFYTGISYMELFEFNKAIECLKVMANNDTSRFSRPALWYISLAYIYIDNTEMATEYLQQLESEDDLYGRNSKKILKKFK